MFRHIEESTKGSEAESDFAGLFDDYDVNSNKLGSTVAKQNEKLIKLLNGVGEMNLGDVKEHSIDAFGDAYEYLMTMYAMHRMPKNLVESSLLRQMCPNYSYALEL